MAANTLAAIRDRVTSVCANTPFFLTLAQTPFDFNSQPAGAIDEVFRVEAEGGRVIGGLSYSETRQDVLRVWLARNCIADPEDTYQTLITDATSLTAAIVRDGATIGDYDVPDAGRGVSVLHNKKEQFAVLRLAIQVDYEAQL